MAHTKRTRSAQRREKNRINIARNKANRRDRWIRRRRRWAEDEEYQQRQKERLERLRAKSGYERNIKEGIRLREENRERKRIRRERFIEDRRRRRIRL